MIVLYRPIHFDGGQNIMKNLSFLYKKSCINKAHSMNKVILSERNVFLRT